MLTNPPYEEAKLLMSISEGDEKAFGVFFNHYYPQLRPFICRFFKSDDEVEDALQEAFIRVWLNRDQLPEIKNIMAWLHTITSRICLNAVRDDLTREKNTGEISNYLPQPTTPADKTTASELKELITMAIDNMPEGRRRIYLLSREEGMKPAKIAETLSLSVSTVKNVLVTALKEIREFLRAHGHIVSLFYCFAKIILTGQ